MKKLDGKKRNCVIARLQDYVLYQIAALFALFAPKRTSNSLHNVLNKRYIYIIERDDIGNGAYKRWMKGNDKMNQADSRKCLQIIRDHFGILIGEVKK